MNRLSDDCQELGEYYVRLNDRGYVSMSLGVRRNQEMWMSLIIVGWTKKESPVKSGIISRNQYDSVGDAQ